METRNSVSMFPFFYKGLAKTAKFPFKEFFGKTKFSKLINARPISLVSLRGKNG